MNYNLAENKGTSSNALLAVAKKFVPFIRGEKKGMIIALIAIVLNSGLNLAAPIIVGHVVDTYIVTRQFDGVVTFSALLLAIFGLATLAQYTQTRVMGAVSNRVLFNLRNVIFTKLQTLPVAFFNQNKAGDLISRINNDTDKLNQFFSQALMQFVGSVFMVIGAGISVLVISPRLGAAALAPALFLLVITRVLSGWMKRKNAKSLETIGDMSASIQESLNNFSVIVAFHRQDYFRERFTTVNEKNFKASITAGLANTIFTPIYGLSSNIAVLVVIAYGAHLIGLGLLTIGVLISFLTYVTRFYDPLRQIASLWSSFQLALAAWDRISDILSMESEMVEGDGVTHGAAGPVLEFKNVKFHYPNGKTVLRDVNLSLEAGKTYALVGPTGGGKTTTASLMARLYDPSEGSVLLHGTDIRSYTSADRAKRIGFILQEPFLFTGTIRDNIVYGNDELASVSSEQLVEIITKSGLSSLLPRFAEGLDTPVTSNGNSMSLGQRQLIAFMRAVLRKPDVLILDEATANIDTVTEQLLEEILRQLPSTTTRVIIAHRLNTIEAADEIYFVNAGTVSPAGSLEHAVSMVMHGKRES